MTRARKTLVDPETTSCCHCIGRCVRRACVAVAQPPLMSLVKTSQDEHIHALGYTERDYLALVGWAGRAVRADKRGVIPNHIPPILNRLGLDPGRFLHHMTGKSKLTHHLTAIGSLDRMQALAKKMGQSFLKGNGLARYFVLRRRVAGKDSVAYHVANFKSRNKLVLLLRSGVFAVWKGP